MARPNVANLRARRALPPFPSRGKIVQAADNWGRHAALFACGRGGCARTVGNPRVATQPRAGRAGLPGPLRGWPADAGAGMGRGSVSGALCLKSDIALNRPRGPMDKASAYGAGDCRLESCRGHCAQPRGRPLAGALSRPRCAVLAKAPAACRPWTEYRARGASCGMRGARSKPWDRLAGGCSH